ncbi:hypothetical protein HUJ05_001807 [Dendroctonus ponderosae]|nr:hypothetical protein HUJ05_001807 [Dendroctonus ponderosae]
MYRDYKAIIENKKTDSCTWKDKDKVWNKIAADFNASSPNKVFRSKESLNRHGKDPITKKNLNSQLYK